MKSIFDESTHKELKERLEKLNENSERVWGKMSVGQMAWHCQWPLENMIENKDRGIKGNPIVRLLFKKMLYNDKPWRKGMPTAPWLKATEEKDFTSEYTKLKTLVDDAYGVRTRKKWNPHTGFGHFTHEQWGQLQYKHLDHHLKQFGV